MATVKVSDKTYKKLNKLAGKLRTELGRPVSVDEALDFAMKEGHDIRGKRLLPSDFVGSWSSMTDSEEHDIMRGLDDFWKGWKKKSRRN